MSKLLILHSIGKDVKYLNPVQQTALIQNILKKETTATAVKNKEA